jgi:protein-S-isoprenylcysteine O-methyltransferase Ste14
MKETVSQRTKRVLGYLAIAIFLSGGCISLVSMETNPFNWPSVCRPIFVLVTFLFFQWFYKDVKSEKEDEEIIKRFTEFKEYREKKSAKDKETK